MSVLSVPDNFEIGELNYKKDYFYNYIPYGLTTVMGGAASGKSLFVYNLVNELTRNDNRVLLFTSEINRSKNHLNTNNYLVVMNVTTFEDVIRTLSFYSQADFSNLSIIIDVDMVRYNNDTLAHLHRIVIMNSTLSVIITTYNSNTYLTQSSHLIFNINKISDDEYLAPIRNRMSIGIIKNRYGCEKQFLCTFTTNPCNIKIKEQWKKNEKIFNHY